MKRFISLYLLLALIEFVQVLEHEKWVNNARDFVTDKRTNILATESTTYSLCTKLRLHDLAFEELELMRNLDDCRKAEKPEKCYFRRERAFHININDSSKPTACIDDLCFFWAVKFGKILHSSSKIIVLEYWDDLVDIWSRCSFMQPVVDASRNLNKTMLENSKDACVTLAHLEIKETIQTIWENFRVCKTEMAQLKKHDMTPHQWVSLEVAKSTIQGLSSCCNGPLMIFQQSIDNSMKKIEECGK